MSWWFRSGRRFWSTTTPARRVRGLRGHSLLGLQPISERQQGEWGVKKPRGRVAYLWGYQGRETPADNEAHVGRLIRTLAQLQSLPRFLSTVPKLTFDDWGGCDTLCCVKAVELCWVQWKLSSIRQAILGRKLHTHPPRCRGTSWVAGERRPTHPRPHPSCSPILSWCRAWF